MSCDFWPAMWATKPTPHASCSCDGTYRPSSDARCRSSRDADAPAPTSSMARPLIAEIGEYRSAAMGGRPAATPRAGSIPGRGNLAGLIGRAVVHLDRHPAPAGDAAATARFELRLQECRAGGIVEDSRRGRAQHVDTVDHAGVADEELQNDVAPPERSCGGVVGGDVRERDGRRVELAGLDVVQGRGRGRGQGRTGAGAPGWPVLARRTTLRVLTSLMAWMPDGPSSREGGRSGAEVVTGETCTVGGRDSVGALDRGRHRDVVDRR